MTPITHTTDTAALALLGERVAAHRLHQNRTQAELAKEAGISKRTLARLEAGESTQLTNLIRTLRALGLLTNLDTLVPPTTPSPLEQLKAKEKQRKRASPQPAHDPADAETPWTWGDNQEEAP